jgi:aspartate beta-hydroxylase
LRIHLALKTPQESARQDPKTGLPLCGIRCGTTVQCWAEGKALVLDDSYDHEVWNHTNEKRVLFLLDIWHPDVSLKERQDIVGMFKHAHEQGWYTKEQTT